jgi:transcriptional regulator with XRE-family HTH domain
MTDLAGILGVSRPTLYNWLKGGPVADQAVLRHLQVLAEAADAWQSVGGPRQDFLLDYTGPGGDEISIRQAMARPEVTAAEIRELVVHRHDQYRQAAARSREFLGELMPPPSTMVPEKMRKMNETWAENAKKRHAARNRES